MVAPVNEAIRPDDILKQLSAYWTNLGADHGSPEQKTESGGLLRACSMKRIPICSAKCSPR